MKGVRCIIFDFDGTLADVSLILFGMVKRLAKDKGIKLPKNPRKVVQSMGIRDVMKKYKISMWEALSLARAYTKELEKHIGGIKVFAGMKPVLEKLSKKYDLGILTSNSEENVRVFLKNNGIDGLFGFVESRNPLFGKNRRLCEVIKKRDYKKSEVVYVGDETRDIEAAKKVGIKIVSVVWGYNSKEHLKKDEPDYIAKNPKDLLNLFKPSI